MTVQFRFRLNGIIMPGIRIQPVTAGGKKPGKWQLAVLDRQVGWFTLEEDRMRGSSLPPWVLEYREETEWERRDALGRQLSKDKGWRQTTPQELIAILQAKAGIELVDGETLCLYSDDPLDTAEFLRQEAEKLRPTKAEIDARTEQLLQRLEFACMLRCGRVRLP